jgi:hypothetical protein
LPLLHLLISLLLQVVVEGVMAAEALVVIGLLLELQVAAVALKVHTQ